MKKIAIIGGGPMGLSTAYYLLKEGFEVKLYERDSVLGGQSASFDFDGVSLERFYHFFCTTDFYFFDLLKELDILDNLVWKETKMGYFINGKLHPWGNPIALLKFPYLSFLEKLRVGFHAFYCINKSSWEDLDSLEALYWLKSFLGERAFNILYEKLFDYKFYEYKNSISAAWIFTRIKRVGKSRYNIFKEKLGYLKGGMNTVLKALEEKIKALKGEIHLNSYVNEIVIENNTLKGIKLNGSFESFDAVLSTIPIPLIPKIAPNLPKEILEKYENIKNIGVVCVIAKLSKKITDNFWVNINDDKITKLGPPGIAGIIEYSNLRDLPFSFIYVPYYLPREKREYKESDNFFINQVKKCLSFINPSLKKEDFLGFKVFRYDYAQPICTPKFLEKLPPISPIKNLYIADTSYYYPEDRGFSESVGFGKKLAKMVKESFI